MTLHLSRQGFAQFALGRLPAGEMNKTEAAYAQYLEVMQHAREIQWFRFEALKLRLADKTFFSPDFVVMAADGVIECHEVKGFMRDDAAVKLKVAAAQFPFRFKLVRKTKGGWDVQNVGFVP